MALVPWTCDFNDESGVDDIPDHIIEAACQASFDDNATMVIGYHPAFGWMYRHIENVGGIAELTKTHVCGSSGLID